jgi:hypothetical protein
VGPGGAIPARCWPAARCYTGLAVSFGLRAPSLLCLLCGLLVSLWSTTATATADRDDCDEMTRAVDVDDGGRDVVGPELVEVVVPCAMIESGALGPDCHDAAFYVVNPQGTLLCRVDVAVLAVSHQTDTLEDGPPATPYASGGHALPPAAAVDVILPRVPPASCHDVDAAVGPPGLDHGRDVAGFSPRPS